MFASGDEAASKQNILPLYEKHAKQLSDSKQGVKNQYGGYGVIVEERGQDPMFDSFLDRYGITPEQYSQIHQQAGNRVIYDPGLKMSAPLLEMAGGKGILQGIGNMLFKKGAKETGEYIGRQANLDSKLNPIKGKFGGTYPQYGDDILTPVTKEGYQLTNPGRFTAGAVSLPLLSGSAVLPEDETVIEAPLTALDQTQVELDKIAAEQSAAKKSKAQKDKADKLKTKQEIAAVNKLLESLDIKEKKEKESFIKRRKERKNRNTGIFLNEMSKAMAATDNLADGIAIGAANSSDAVMQADEAEELSYAEFLKEEKEKNEPKDLKETTVLQVIEKYGEQVGALEGSILLNSKLVDLKQMLLDPSKDISGLSGFFKGVQGKIEGAFGADGRLLDRQKAVGIVKFLQARMVQDLLDEKGKTISDADRMLIKELLGNLESTVSNRSDIIELLNNVTANLNNSMREQKRFIKIYDRRYADRIEELDELKIEFNIPKQADAEQEDDATMLDPSLIEPIG